MARTFVTGANGFIGSHMIERLLQRGDEVIGLVRPDSDVRSLPPLLETHGDRLRIVVGDLLDLGTLEPALDGVQAVYHLGASLMATSEKMFHETNVTGTRNLLEAVVRRCSSGFQRFLFASAQAAAGPSRDGRPIDESRQPQPVSSYGKSKMDAETLVNQFSDRIPITIVRPVAVYGEREQDISGGTFPMVKAGLAPRLGFASKTASLIYVGDVVTGMIAAAESPRSLGKTYFLADPKPYPQHEVIEAIGDAMGNRIRIPIIVPHFFLVIVSIVAEWTHAFTRRRPMLTRDKVRELKHRWWIVTPAAAERDLGWTSQVGLRQGMAIAVADWNRRQLDPHPARIGAETLLGSRSAPRNG